MPIQEIRFERKADFKEFKKAHYESLQKVFFGQEDIDAILLAIFQYGEQMFQDGVDSIDDIVP